ncbi:MAG: hypothetical protein E6J41_24505 [Chloroflexi bacterium]|nr:MAG: hypothetical protein E6J41_24505 [Chloroflexota bacterium]
MSAGSRRRLVAVLAALTAFALQPGTAGRAGLDDSFNPDCPAATALPAVTGKVLQFTGALQCFRPGGSAPFGSNVAPADRVIREPAPKLGDPCQNIYYHPVTFTEDTSPTGDPTGHFSILGNVTTGQLGVDDASMIGTHDAFVSDTQLGSYELTNPNDPNSPLQCVLNPTFHFFCPATGVVGPPLCFTWVLHPITGNPTPPANLAPFFANVLGSLQASPGTIHSAPATKGVVNTPACFWIDGITIPQEQDLTLVLPGPLDGSGRQVFFTYFARIQFQGVDWNFDDPLSVTPAQVPPPCQGQNLVTAHQYAQISDERNADGKYHVTATERYSISVVVYWYDSDGPHGPVTVDPGVSAPTLTTNAYPQYVGQVEGVPIGGQ